MTLNARLQRKSGKGTLFLVSGSLNFNELIISTHLFDLSFVKRSFPTETPVKISGIGTKAIDLDFIGYESKYNNC